MRFAFVGVFLFAITFAEASSLPRTWVRLLHNGRIQNPAFYYTPGGYKTPERELVATLEWIKSEPLDTPEEKRFACRFPARKRFIKKYLNITPRLDCPDMPAPDSVSFIFASQFLGNPSSSMGHSFLRFDHERYSNLLGRSVSYFAKTSRKENPLLYALKGLFGGYEGRYEIDHYYPKSHRYGSMENRDLWEYKLRLTPEETLFVLEHAYELSFAGHEKYYFFNRNCSYLLLELLDVAREDLSLASEVDGPFVSPQQSIRVLANNNLIVSENFRPSLRQKANAYYESLNRKQKKALGNVLKNQEESHDPKVLSAAVAILTMREVSGQSSSTETEVLRRASNTRALLPQDSSVMEQLNRDNKNRNPLYGHDMLQAHVGVAATDKTSGIQIGFRPATHALDDLPVGYLPNSQIQFLDTAIRAEGIDSKARLRLRKLTFLDIKSLPSYSLVNDQLSWTMQMALVPTLGSRCVDCRAVRSGGAVGFSADLHKRILGYAVAGGTVDFLKVKERTYGRVGPTLSTGLLSQMSDKVFFRLESRIDYFFMGPFDQETIWTSEASVALQLSRNSSFATSVLEAWNLESSEFHSKDFVLRFSQHF